MLHFTPIALAPLSCANFVEGEQGGDVSRLLRTSSLAETPPGRVPLILQRARAGFMRTPLFALPFLIIAAPAAAQQSPDDALYDRALAAGYKAQFICSGLWNGGKTMVQIEADELTGIYDRIADIVPTLTAEIGEPARQVRVAFDTDMPPRTAQWRAGLGCAGLPIGADPADGARLPHFSGDPAPYLIDESAWPMGDRDALAPSAGNSPVADAVTKAMSGTFGGATSAALVMRDGKIIAERYKPGFDEHTSQRTWSVAKSLAGTLIGHAVHRGIADPAQPAALAQWRDAADPRGKITLDHLMRMASGLYSDTAGNRTDPVYMGGSAAFPRAAHWPLLHTPASQFRYANNDILNAWRSVYERLPEDERLGFPVALFRKLGMTRTIAETDWRGNFILSSQVWTTSRDLARFGMLYLNDGMWEGERLLPENWREFVSTPGGPQPDGEFGYGATFWLMNRTEGVPQDAFAAFGNRGQYVVIIPSLDMVIVRRGYDTSENRFDIAAFTLEVVLAATP